MDVRRDIVLLVLGALLGAVVSTALNVANDEASGGVTIAAAVILLLTLACLLTIRVLGPLHLVFGNARGIALSGRWKGAFEYEKAGSTVTVSEILEIQQRGRYLRGTSRSTSVSDGFPLESTCYAFSASIAPDGVIDGNWRNTVPGERFHGSFQARTLRHGKVITGTWIGIEERTINKGEFEWKRVV